MWDITLSGRGELGTAPISIPILWMCGSPDGSLVAECRSDGSVGLLDTTDLHEITQVVVSPIPYDTIFPGLSYDNTHLAVDVGGKISVWDIQTEQILTIIPKEDGWEEKYAFPPSFSPDGTLLATGGYSGKITVWNLFPVQRKVVLPLRPGSPMVFGQFSPDGTHLAMGCWRTSDSGGGEVWIWDLVEVDKPPRILNTDKTAFSCLSFSPDGRHLATCGNDPVSQIWDLAGSKVSVVLRRHAGSPRSIRYSPDGQYIITASIDGSVKIWDPESGTELLSYNPPGVSRPFSAFFTPNSRRVVTGDIDKQYRLLSFKDIDELIALVSTRVTRDWTFEERRRYLLRES